jgi:hypothetical protein
MQQAVDELAATDVGLTAIREMQIKTNRSGV